MYVYLASAWTFGQMLSIFWFTSLFHHRSLPVEYEYSGFKNKGPSYGLKTQNDDFLKNSLADFIQILAVSGDNRHK
jgi:hypothetical protein